MVVELINTGNELLLGRILNTNQQWLCRQLANRGWPVSRQLAVGDSEKAIQDAVKDALSRADVVVITGGLGPTTDDLTCEAVAHLLGRPLREDPAVLQSVGQYFATRKRPMPESTRRQALVPEGALVLPNTVGTAPGLAIQVDTKPFTGRAGTSWLILLPGPPLELEPMFLNSVVPLLTSRLLAGEGLTCRTIRTIGIGESLVQERILSEFQSLIAAGLEVGYCARPGEVDVRFLARGSSDFVEEAVRRALANLGDACYGFDDDTLEGVVIASLVSRDETVALAESCTGGLIAHRLTNVPGASAVFVGGFVTYSNELKQSALGVRRETLERHGAVSEPVAREMAEGARQRTNSTYAIAVTGIAGPSGGSAEKPVGTVFIALATPAQTRVWKHLNSSNRKAFKKMTASQALNYLRLTLSRDHRPRDHGKKDLTPRT